MPKASVLHMRDYQQPFGKAPAQGDLTEVFLSLPDKLVADMPKKSRRMFIEMQGAESDMFNPSNRYLAYYSDNPYSDIKASSLFYLKVLPSSRYGYVVLIHMAKAVAANRPPSAMDTFVLAPVAGRWMDITEQTLPKAVVRDWVFQPRATSDRVESGPYRTDRSGRWTWGTRVMDLVWMDDEFHAQAPSSPEYSYD